MNLFLHIKTIDDELFLYDNFDIQNAVYIDLDNFSMSETIQVVKKAIYQSHTLMVYFEFYSNKNSSVINRLFSTIVTYKNKKRLVYSGYCEQFYQLNSVLKSEKINKNQIIELSNLFFNDDKLV